MHSGQNPFGGNSWACHALCNASNRLARWHTRRRRRGRSHRLGAGRQALRKPGDILLKFGGSIDVLIATEKASPDPRMFLDYHLIPGCSMPNGCMASGGFIFKTGLQKSLLGGEADTARQAGITLHQHLDRIATTTPPGADGVQIIPYFLGEKTPLHDNRRQRHHSWPEPQSRFAPCCGVRCWRDYGLRAAPSCGKCLKKWVTPRADFLHQTVARIRYCGCKFVPTFCNNQFSCLKGIPVHVWLQAWVAAIGVWPQ